MFRPVLRPRLVPVFYRFVVLTFSPLEPYDTKQVNVIGGIVKLQGIVIVILKLEHGNGKIHSLKFESIYYFPGAPKLLDNPKNVPVKEEKKKYYVKEPTSR